MKLQHHLGGLEGLDPVIPETRVFVEPWETRIFGIHVAMMALSQHLQGARETPTAFSSEWTWASLRKGAEAMNPFDYFKYRYYEKWLGGISGFLVDQGYVDGAALEARTRLLLEEGRVPVPAGGASAIDTQIEAYLRTGDSAYRDIPRKPRFAVGERVMVKDGPVQDHTRLPGYLRGHAGTVDLVYDGNYTYFCSTGVDGLGEPMPVYFVRFQATDIWGGAAEPNVQVYADLYEAYLDGD